MEDLILEACVEALEQAVLAESNGAHRIELCSDLAVGGLTPPEDLLLEVLSKVKIPIMVMVRPREGSFVFTNEEMRLMIHTIKRYKKLGIHGFVIGNLTEANKIDIQQTMELSRHASPFEVTFHKAIDETVDLIESTKTISQITGIQRILTSGGRNTAAEGATKIRAMRQAAGSRLTILSAGKITKDNLKEIHSLIGGLEYHGRRIVY